MVIEVADHRPTRTPHTRSRSQGKPWGSFRRIVLLPRSTVLLRRPQHDRACRAVRRAIVQRFVPEGSKNAKRRRFAAVSGWADGSGSGNGLPGASGRACLLLESGALGYSAGAVSSRLPAATCGQAARSYSWTMPPWTSLRVIQPLPTAMSGRGIGWASCRPRCGLASL